MFRKMPITQFRKRYPDNNSCLEEIVKMRYPDGIYCPKCKRYTTHYRVKERLAYTCKNCRKQIHPLAGTIFEKTSTPLRLWFYAMFLMTHTQGEVTATQLQKELQVTYKTAWRMHKRIHNLLELKEKDKIYKWVFFKRFEISVIEQDSSQ